MSKDSYWFKHDATAGKGLRMLKIKAIHGHWGKGIYWDTIEILRNQSGYKYPCDETSLQIFCDLIGCNDLPKFMSWFNDCLSINLLQKNNGFFFSDVLVKNMKKWEAKKSNGSKGGRGNKSETKAKSKLTAKLNESIIEDKIIEDKIIEDTESILKNLFSQIQWRESVCMGQSISLAQFEIMLKTFLNELLSKDDLAKSEKEIKQHFVNWIKYNKPKNGVNGGFKRLPIEELGGYKIAYRCALADGRRPLQDTIDVLIAHGVDLNTLKP